MERLNPFAAQYEVHGSGTFDITIKTVTLRGHGVDAADARPIVEASVELRPSTGQTIFGGRGGHTHAAGHFVVQNIGPGSYQNTAAKARDGHGCARRSVRLT